LQLFYSYFLHFTIITTNNCILYDAPVAFFQAAFEDELEALAVVEPYQILPLIVNLTVGIVSMLREADRVKNGAVQRKSLKLFEDLLLRAAGRIRDRGGQHDGLVHG